ncbi:MKI67 FHA domain-interacting nucleolar phosphoprotein-like [Eufriesea mexicana]|uniref:MKI67 FHA domain-interacting nucleolar phosphoprotein-like n=1 Tax=Eufriesea mexicana TaxID=516756 RepID=UPI00083BE23E|nr:PREDICTED: MKI67 FHA domain-interacting nucleolar phosphoprotein-like [Eufriesea mexicana]OAD55832.1 MKI67 FHA domain-interacting nucleolar phosphoprotein-like [Eufriesea mexicana]
MKIKKKSNALRVPPVKKAIRVKRKSSDIEEESTVFKAIENVKKVLEKKNIEETKTLPPLVSKHAEVRKSHKITKVKRNRGKRRKVYPRGIVYLGHIPHGFFEEQMTDYFKQFGEVTRVRVVRSKNSGRSRGYGYVEFMYPEVARVAAETMNNYLMCGRLLKATYIPPEKQHRRFFAGTSWTKEIYPKLINRNEVNKLRNRDIGKNEHRSFIQSTRDKLSALQNKLKEKGFDIEFIPVDGSK